MILHLLFVGHCINMTKSNICIKDLHMLLPGLNLDFRITYLFKQTIDLKIYTFIIPCCNEFNLINLIHSVKKKKNEPKSAWHEL